MQSAWHHYTVIGVAMATVLLTVQASAQNPGAGNAAVSSPQNPSPQVVEEILVRGQRLNELQFDLPSYVRDFIAEVVSLPPGGGFARWHRTVCIGVHNLEPIAAQYIADRISYLADDVGLKPGEPGCRPDVIIIFTTDANELATYMVENQPLAFRPGGGECCMQLGLAALDEFARSDKAVRWWHVSMPVSATTGDRAIVMPQDEPGTFPVISVAGPSRIHNGIRDELHHVIIIVDGTRLAGTTWQQIGDYLALVSLAQIDPNANPAAFDSILNLFTNRAAYSGLTDWDRSYVQALYAINLERLPQLQRNEIVSHIARRERGQKE